LAQIECMIQGTVAASHEVTAANDLRSLGIISYR